MRKNAIVDLPKDFKLVLRQIRRDKADDLTMLSETLNIQRARLSHIVASLRQKGLVKISNHGLGEIWVRLSSRGAKLIGNVWPETMLSAA
jgi:DNA-binding MarR family transcriptional regulator